MSRLVWMLMLAGLLAPVGCEQRPAERLPGKVTADDVRRDANQAVKSAEEYSRQTEVEVQKRFDATLPDRTSEKATSESVRRDAGQAAKAAKEHSKQTKDGIQMKLNAQLPDSTPGKVMFEDARGDAGQAGATASDDSKRSKAEFQKKLEAQLNDLDGKLTTLRARGRDLKGSDKTNWDQMMAELDVKRDTARARLDRVVHTSVESWNDVKQKAESAWDELDRAFRNACNKF